MPSVRRPLRGLTAAITHTDDLNPWDRLEPWDMPHTGVVSRTNDANANWSSHLPLLCKGPHDTRWMPPRKADYSASAGRCQSLDRFRSAGARPGGRVRSYYRIATALTW